jgi:hypothetical protein
MRKIFSLARRVVWAAVLAALFCAVGFWFAFEGDLPLVLASGFAAASFALLSLRASR